MPGPDPRPQLKNRRAVLRSSAAIRATGPRPQVRHPAAGSLRAPPAPPADTNERPRGVPAPRAAVPHWKGTMSHRPPDCRPGTITEPRYLGERLRASRERLAASDEAGRGRAWRLWAVCADATFGYSREADQTYVSALARAAGGMNRNEASRLLRRFHELGVFVWEPAPQGSHGISRLALPALGVPDTGHAPPTVRVEATCTAHGACTCTAHGALHSYELSNYGHELCRGVEEAGRPQGLAGGLGTEPPPTDDWLENLAALEPTEPPEPEPEPHGVLARFDTAKVEGVCARCPALKGTVATAKVEGVCAAFVHDAGATAGRSNGPPSPLSPWGPSRPPRAGARP